MLFNSYEFIFIFFSLVVLGYYALLSLSRKEISRAWLISASIFFYGWWKIDYVPLLLSSIIINYLLFRKLLKVRKIVTEGKKKRRRKKSKEERRILIIALVFNITLLMFFKYVDFFIWNINAVSGSELQFLRIVLPLGISFFTLQQIAFQIDAYEEVVEDSGFINYSLFVSFFPQLVAGPIVHHKEMMPQFLDEKRLGFSAETFYRGLTLFVIGLTKKAVVADTFAVWATNGYDQVGDLSFFPAWAAVVCYTLQLYFDFSGYSDMAMGLGRMLNIELPVNFKSPFRATNLISFWNCWHMTLTRFITTYLYFPIAKALPGKTFAYSMTATFLSMFIAGFWHGAAWTFVVFGSIHGLGLVLNNITRKLKIKMKPWMGWAFTMILVLNANVFFRAKDFDSALRLLEGMYFLNGLTFDPYQFVSVAGIFAIDTVMMFGAVLVAAIVIFTLPNSVELTKDFKPRPAMAVAIAVMFWVSLAHFSATSEFLYFNF